VALGDQLEPLARTPPAQLLGRALLNQPPGLHWLDGGGLRGLAAAGRPWPPELAPEMLVRLAPALLSQPLVPLIGLLQLRLRPRRAAPGRPSAAPVIRPDPATPLARHGRLAMLDGGQLLAMVCSWLGLLRAPAAASQSRWAIAVGFIAAGLAASALCSKRARSVLPVLGQRLAAAPCLTRDLRVRDWAWLGLAWALGLALALALARWHCCSA